MSTKRIPDWPATRANTRKRFIACAKWADGNVWYGFCGCGATMSLPKGHEPVHGDIIECEFCGSNGRVSRIPIKETTFVTWHSPN